MAVTEPDIAAPAAAPQPPIPQEPAKPQPRPRYLTLCLWLSVVLFLLLCHRVFVYTPDDAYITFRYAKNLAEGYGPVFNRLAPVSERTEGYSCPLFMVLMALLYKLPMGLDLLVKAKLLGVGLGLGVLVLGQRLARRVGLPLWAQAAFPLLLAAHPNFLINSMDGMETSLAALLTTLAVLLFLDGGREETEGNAGTSRWRRPSAFSLSALAFAGCALTRPEGILFGLAALGVLVVGRRGRLGAREGRWLLLFGLPVVSFLLWRHWYYGLWLPNTYYAKQLYAEEAVFGGGKYLLRTFFKAVSGEYLLVGLAAGWWGLVIAGGISARFQRAPNVLVPLAGLAQIIFVLKSGGDGMGGWRFMASVVPLLMLLAVAGVVEVADGLARLVRSAGPLAQRAAAGTLCAAILATCLLGQTAYWNSPYDGYRSWASASFAGNERQLLRGWLLELTLPASDWLNAHLPPGSTVAYSEMGVTPYLCPQLNFLDVQGLTDHGVATLPGALHNGSGVQDLYITTKDVVGRYLMDTRKPEYIMRGMKIAPDETFAPPGAILEDTYALLSAIPLPRPPNGGQAFLCVWQRRK